MSIKKIINNTLLVIGMVAIGLCSVIAVKNPEVFTELIGIHPSESGIIQSVPYYVNFGDLGTSDSSYKTQYFKYANRSWYLSWGNHGSTNHANDSDNFNMLLGWNATKKPVYGGYSYITEVMQNIEVKENYNYSYVIMDFDFNINHNVDFSFRPFESLTSGDTSLYFISSHDSGGSWHVVDTMTSAQLIHNAELKFSYAEDSLISRTSRYGLCLVSNKTSARIELNQFVVSRLSLV